MRRALVSFGAGLATVLYSELNMECSQITNDLLFDLAVDELEPGPAGKIRSHLESCPQCRKRFTEIKDIRSQLKEETRALAVDISPGIDDAVMKTYKTSVHRPESAPLERGVSLRSWALTAAACIVIGLMLGAFLFQYQASEDSAASRNETEAAPSNKSAMGYLTNDTLASRSSESDYDNSNIITKSGKGGSKDDEFRTLYEEALQAARVMKISSDRLRGELETVKKEKRNLADALDKTRKDLENTRGKVEETEKKLAALEMKNKNASRNSELLAGKIETLEKRVNDYTSAFARLEKENAELKKALVVMGDLSGDDRVDVSDAMTLCERLLEKDNIEYDERADLNADGKVDVGDALAIMNKTLAEEPK